MGELDETNADFGLKIYRHVPHNDVSVNDVPIIL